MQSITSVTTLREAITTLESRRRDQEQALASHLILVYDGLKPVNMMKNTVRAIVQSPDVRHDIINAGIGMVLGYLPGMMLIRSQSGPVKKILGAALQLGMTTLFGTKGDAIKTGGLKLLHRFLGNRNGNGSR